MDSIEFSANEDLTENMFSDLNINTEFQDINWNDDPMDDFSQGQRRENNEFFLYYLKIPNIENYLLMETRIKNLTKEISNNEYMISFYEILSHFNTIKHKNNISDIMKIGNKELTGTHLMLKSKEPRLVSFLNELIKNMIIGRDYLLIIKVLKLLEKIGIHLDQYIIFILEKLALDLEMRNHSELIQLLDFLIKWNNEEIQYGNLLFLLYHTNKKTQELPIWNLDDLGNLKQTFSHVVGLWNKESKDNETLKDFFNFVCDIDHVNLDDLLANNILFQKKWNQNCWFYTPKSFEYEQIPNRIEDSDILISLELKNHMESVVEMKEKIKEFKEIRYFIMAVLNSSLKNKEGIAETMVKVSLINKALKFILYSQTTSSIFIRQISLTMVDVMSQKSNNILKQIIKSNKLEQVLRENIYFFTFIIMNDILLKSDKDTFKKMFSLLIKLKIELYEYSDQIHLLDIYQILIQYKFMFSEEDIVQFRKHIIMILRLSASFNTKINITILFLMRIISFFKGDLEILEKVVQSLSYRYNKLTNHYLINVDKKANLVDFIIRNQYFWHYILVILMEVEKNCKRNWITESGLISVYNFSHFYSLSKSFGMDTNLLTDFYFESMPLAFNSLVPNSQQTFFYRFGQFVDKKEELSLKTNFISEKLFDADFQAQLKDQFGLR